MGNLGGGGGVGVWFHRKVVKGGEEKRRKKVVKRQGRESGVVRLSAATIQKFSPRLKTSKWWGFIFHEF